MIDKYNSRMPIASPVVAHPSPLDEALSRLERSSTFSRATSQLRLLRYLAQQIPAEPESSLSEVEIGVGFFGRDPAYDTGNDAIVRVSLSRLRSKLERYYQTEGQDDDVRLSIPVGIYSLRIEERKSRPVVPSEPEVDMAALPVEPPRRRALVWLTVCALVLASAAGLMALHHRTARGQSWLDRPLQLRPLTPGDGSEAFPAFSPDGRQLVYSGRRPDAGSYSLFIKPTHSAAPGVQVPTPAGNALHAAWSPDGRSLAYLLVGPRDSTIQVVDLSTGNSRSVAQLPWYALLDEDVFADSRTPGPTWTRDGASLIFALRTSADGPERLVLKNLATGEQKALTTGDADEEDGNAEVSPDGKTLVFLRKRTPADCDVDLLDLKTLAIRTLARKWGSVPAVTWNPNGRELVVSVLRGRTSDTLWRVPLSGEPSMVTTAPEFAFQVAFSPAEPLIAVTTANVASTVALVSTLGRASPAHALFPATERTGEVTLAPSGRQFAFISDRSGSLQVWSAPLENTSDARQLTDALPATPYYLAWAPDERKLAVVLRGPGQNGILLLDPATRRMTRLLTPCLDQDVLPLSPTWAPDGKSIFFSILHAAQTGIYRASVEGPPACERLSPVATHRARPVGDHAFYVAASRGAGIFRVEYGSGIRVPVPQLQQVQPASDWEVEDGALLYIDINAPVRTLQRFDPATGSVTTLSPPLERVDFSGFSYSAAPHRLIFHQHNEDFLSRIMAVEPLPAIPHS